MENKTLESEQKKKSKTKVADIILTTVGGLLLLVTAVLVISKFINKDKLVFGFRSDIVLTDSMASIDPDLEEEYIEKGWTNQLKVHDWIFTTKVSEEELQVGDIVTYNNPIIGVTTHRVVDVVVHPTTGVKYYSIRGDANPNDDGNFKYEAIIGKVTHNAGQFGQVIFFLQSIYGVILMVGLALICFVYSFLSDYTKSKTKKTKTTNEQ